MDVNKLKDNWRKDHALLLSHIGSSDGHVGLKNPGEQLILDTRGMRAAGLNISYQYDILSLDFGRYIGKNFINGPEGINPAALCIVNIQGYPGFMKRIIFEDTSTGFLYQRTVYAYGDTGWNDNNSLSAAWRDIQLINGFSGDAKISKFDSPSFQGLEIRLNISGRIPAGQRSQGIGTLPGGYTTLQAPRIYFTGVSTPGGGEITNDNSGVGTVSPVGISIGSGKDIFIHRMDSQPVDTITIRANNFIRRGAAY